MKERITHLLAVCGLLVFFLISPFLVHHIFSLECKPGFTYQNKEELEIIRNLCEQKVSNLRNKVTTLSSQIQLMDTQIYLTGLRIQATEQKIEDTQKDIELLSTRIESLDNSLTYLSKQFFERIVQGYKNQSISLFNLFFDSENANEFFNKVKYQKTTQDNNQKLLIQVQESKLNFEEQKKIREKKMIELDQLNATLNNQKIDLDNQKIQKQKLLADTRNDESLYQQLLNTARTQLATFKSFVQSSGASSIINANAFGNGSDGAYFSQRDVRWASQAIGGSSESILDVGCLLTSIAIFAKKNGQDINPSQMASETFRFWATTAWMRLPWSGVAGKNYTSVSNIDNELAQGNYVIVGVKISNCNAGGNHYVVLTRKDGDDYIMHDPIYGPDLKFSSHYSTICSSATFK